MSQRGVRPQPVRPGESSSAVFVVGYLDSIEHLRDAEREELDPGEELVIDAQSRVEARALVVNHSIIAWQVQRAGMGLELMVE